MVSTIDRKPGDSPKSLPERLLGQSLGEVMEGVTDNPEPDADLPEELAATLDKKLRALFAPSSEDPEFLYDFGMQLYERGDMEAAYDYLQQAVSLDEENPDYSFALGCCVFTLTENPEKALPYLLKANELQPDTKAFKDVLCLCYRALGDFKKARELLIQCVEPSQGAGPM